MSNLYLIIAKAVGKHDDKQRLVLRLFRTCEERPIKSVLVLLEVSTVELVSVTHIAHGVPKVLLPARTGLLKYRVSQVGRRQLP